MKIEKVYNKKKETWEFVARFQLNGKRFYPRALTRKKLLETIDEIRAIEHRRVYELPVARAAVTLGYFIETFTKTFDLTNKNHRRRKAVLLDFVSFFESGFTVQELTTADIKNFVESRRKKSKLAPWSVHALLTIISSALHTAPETLRELSDYRPPKIPWVKVPDEGAGRVITHEEREKLLAALRAPRQKIKATMKSGVKADRLEQLRDVFTRHELADMFELALNTGMRWGEVKRLEWSFFNEKQKLLKLPGEICKSGKSRVVYANERVMEILSIRRVSAKTVWIFPNPSGTCYRKYYSKSLRTVAKRIGMKYGRELSDGFTPHSTRHTAGTMLVRQTDLKTAGELLGHNSLKSTLVYVHSNEKLKRSAMDKLSEILQDKN